MTFLQPAKAGLIAALLLTLGIAAVPQTKTHTHMNPGQPANEGDPVVVQQQRRMQKEANLQRQRDIQKDSEKLLELATELKQSVEQSSENTLSLDVVRKAEQIEKLAKSVKEKMKGS